MRRLSFGPGLRSHFTMSASSRIAPGSWACPASHGAGSAAARPAPAAFHCRNRAGWASRGFPFMAAARGGAYAASATPLQRAAPAETPGRITIHRPVHRGCTGVHACRPLFFLPLAAFLLYARSCWIPSPTAPNCRPKLPAAGPLRSSRIRMRARPR